MHKKNDYDFGSGVGGGTGTMHGKIASPQDPCGYELSANTTKSELGGEPVAPFGSYKESPNLMMGVSRDSMTANITVQGGISTPMDTSKAAMPGITGSDGTGATSGGEAKISSPFVSPFGDKVGG